MDKTILITGCSTGIGYAAAKILNERGYKVIASARKAEDVEKIKNELGVLAVRLDLADPKSIKEALAWTLQQTGGRLDYLFNNGAFAIPCAVEDLSREALQYQLNACLLGWQDLIVQVIPIMRSQGAGRIVNNSSVLGVAAMRYRGAYVATKFALEGLTDVLRMELYGSGIWVSLIEPGPIVSNFRKNSYDNFKKWVDFENSLHKEQYQEMIKRLESTKKAPFTKGADAVVDALIKALESPKPKARYRVCGATTIMAFAKRLLPTALMDSFVRKISKEENKKYN